MTKIAFNVNHFSIRGTEIAIFDYAYYNKKILGNESVIITPDNYKFHTHPINGLTFDQNIFNKFFEEFQIFEYSSIDNMEKILEKEKCNIFYILKEGTKDPFVSRISKTVVHCIFTCTTEHFHGDIYASISPSKSLNKANAPVVPHICNSLPIVQGDLRDIYNIPKNVKVFGCYGGYEAFSIKFVHETIKNIVNRNPNIFFLFMNFKVFYEHKNIIYIPKNTKPEYKSKFINTCDAMLHAREQGESFGLAIAEFTSLGKPIITWKHDGEPFYHEHLNHIETLGETGIYYRNQFELYQILTYFDLYKKIPVNYSVLFSPEKVMKLFNDYMIKPLVKNNFNNLDMKVVNLDYRSSRLLKFEEECRKHNVKNVQKFSAIVGSNYNLDDEIIQKLFDIKDLLTKQQLTNVFGVIGCSLSHYNLWLEVINNKKKMLIFEDDITFKNNFISNLEIILNKSQSIDWDIILIGYHKDENIYKINNLELNYLEKKFKPNELIDFNFIKKFNLNKSFGLLGGGTFGYIISENGAKKMVEMIKNSKFYYPVDYQILENAYYNGLKLFTCSHPLLTSPKFGIDTDYSDVQL